jgi:hypothetical protein
MIVCTGAMHLFRMRLVIGMRTLFVEGAASTLTCPHTCGQQYTFMCPSFPAACSTSATNAASCTLGTASQSTQPTKRTHVLQGRAIELAPPSPPYSVDLGTACAGKAVGAVVLVGGGFDVCPAAAAPPPPKAKSSGDKTIAIAVGAGVGGAALLGVLIVVAVAARRRRSRVQPGGSAPYAEPAATPRSPGVPGGSMLPPVLPTPRYNAGAGEEPAPMPAVATPRPLLSAPPEAEQPEHTEHLPPLPPYHPPPTPPQPAQR